MQPVLVDTGPLVAMLSRGADISVQVLDGYQSGPSVVRRSSTFLDHRSPTHRQAVLPKESSLD